MNESDATRCGVTHPQPIMDAQQLVSWIESARGSGKQVMPIGGGTKLRLSSEGSGRVLFCDMKPLAGVTAYDASEYLISAKAGTRLWDLIEVLQENGQYFPFDPCLVHSGSTIGGAIAAGISGPCRGLYGAIRDFVMEVVFVDGLGKIVRGGGRVVKNAAGFDFPKLLVGSMGRMGILTEVTLKVFPKPAEWLTVTTSADSIHSALTFCQRLQAQSLPITGLYLKPNSRVEVQARFAGPSGSCVAVAERVRGLAAGLVEHQGESEGTAKDDFLWQEQSEGSRDGWVRTVQSPGAIVGLDAFCSQHNMQREYWSGGDVAWIKPDASALNELNECLISQKISGMRFPLEATSSYRIGASEWVGPATRIQRAIDPDGLFAAF